MDGANTIILLKGEAFIGKHDYEKFSKGDTIIGLDSNPEEIKRWNILDEKEAKKEIEKYCCEYYERPEAYDVVEYALQYCRCDENGDFVEGSDYDLANEK